MTRLEEQIARGRGRAVAAALLLDISREPDPARALALFLISVRDAGLESAAELCDRYGGPGDHNTADEYAHHTAPELAARIRALKVGAETPGLEAPPDDQRIADDLRGFTLVDESRRAELWQTVRRLVEAGDARAARLTRPSRIDDALDAIEAEYPAAPLKIGDRVTIEMVVCSSGKDDGEEWAVLQSSANAYVHGTFAPKDIIRSGGAR